MCLAHFIFYSVEPEIGLMLYNNAISKATPERVIFYYAEIIYVLLFITHYKHSYIKIN